MFAPPPNQIIIALPCNPTLTEFLFQSGACLFEGIVLHFRSKASIPARGVGIEFRRILIRCTVFKVLSEVKGIRMTNTSMCLDFIGDLCNKIHAYTSNDFQKYFEF